MSALYEIAEARLLLDRRLYESEGELTPELEAELDQLDCAFDDKVQRVALYIREQLASADAVKAEEDRLQRKRHAHVKTADSLRSYLQRQMTAVGKDKVAGTLVTVALVQNPPSVSGELNETQLFYLSESHPELVKTIPQTQVLDRKAVLAHVRAGHDAPSGLAITREPSLRIR